MEKRSLIPWRDNLRVVRRLFQRNLMSNYDNTRLMMYGNKIYYERGGLRIDLETGGVAKVDGRKTVGGGRAKASG